MLHLFLFGKADAGKLRVGKDRPGHALVVNGFFCPAQSILCRERSLVAGGRFLTQGEVGHIADGKDVRLRCLEGGGDHNGASFVNLNPGLLKPEVFCVGRFPGGKENFVAGHFLRFSSGEIGKNLFVAAGPGRLHLGIRFDHDPFLFEYFLQSVG